MITERPKRPIKKVLICPLDWGLGHATRVIPIVEHYLEKGDQVILGGNGSSIQFLQKRFPNLTCEFVPGYGVVYSKRIGFAVKMLLSLPTIYSGIKKEEKQVAWLHEQYGFDLIISDNRFGVHASGVQSLFMTHQLNIKFPYFESIIFKVQRQLIEQFDACLVPDFSSKEKLAGSLSELKVGQELNVPLYYLGALSRFYRTEFKKRTIKYPFVAVISGPEPHKSALTNLLISSFSSGADKLAIITYDFDVKRIIPDHIKLFQDCNDEQFLTIISESETMISRSGYSTLMDMIFLNKKVFFIPTPGQTEQLYLAKYAATKGWANWCLQEDFSLSKIKSIGEGFPTAPSTMSEVLEKIEKQRMGAQS